MARRRPAKLGDRLHGWMFGLLYPAVLGTMIFSTLTTSVPTAKIEWAWLLIVYFILLFGEDLLSIRTYTRVAFTIDLIELVAIVVLFALLDVQPKNNPLTLWVTSWAPLNVLLAITMLLPPLSRGAVWVTGSLGRGLKCQESQKQDKTPRGYATLYVVLTGMSVAGAAIALFAPASWSYVLLSALIGLYGVVMVLCRNHVVNVFAAERPPKKRAAKSEEPAEPASEVTATPMGERPAETPQPETVTDTKKDGGTGGAPG